MATRTWPSASTVNTPRGRKPSGVESAQAAGIWNSHRVKTLIHDAHGRGADATDEVDVDDGEDRLHRHLEDHRDGEQQHGPAEGPDITRANWYR